MFKHLDAFDRHMARLAGIPYQDMIKELDKIEEEKAEANLRDEAYAERDRKLYNEVQAMHGAASGQSASYPQGPKISPFSQTHAIPAQGLAQSPPTTPANALAGAIADARERCTNYHRELTQLRQTILDADPLSVGYQNIIEGLAEVTLRYIDQTSSLIHLTNIS